MKLDDIGFYTLSDSRVKNLSKTSPLQRCEMIVTDKCNFKCPYCRGLRKDLIGDIDPMLGIEIIRMWCKNNMKCVRFSGGEPTTYSALPIYVALCKDLGVERIAVSTNGSWSLKKYKELINLGVNDFSISLDSGCCSIGDKMTGIVGSWKKVVKNIRELSKLTYVTVGMVFTETNVDDAVNSIKFADSLGVADIRIIGSAQYNKAIGNLRNLDKELLNRHPILKYRVNNYLKGINIRGISEKDSHRCGLVLDDMAVAQGYHFPCIIYMREGGNPIGSMVSSGIENVREERYKWYKEHNIYNDPICRNNCLDVCVEHCNKIRDARSDL